MWINERTAGGTDRMDKSENQVSRSISITRKTAHV